MTIILQDSLPQAHWDAVRLPGTSPCDADDWLRCDDAYAGQLAYRSQLLAQKPEAVLVEAPQTGAEVLQEALKILPGLGFAVKNHTVSCPDGRAVAIDFARPLWTLGHLVQEDICILERLGDEHVMTGAVVCFPANWRLDEKINRPLTGIHDPVDEYDDNVARRVQRLFDGIQVGRPIWRFNRLTYVDADLHQPYKRAETGHMPYVRSERQCLLRLPQSGAVIFTIHTFVVAA